eukprot:9500614-Pyramimonas_sp.AAC.1
MAVTQALSRRRRRRRYSSSVDSLSRMRSRHYSRYLVRLAWCWVQGDMMHKRVQYLSGGEKARVALAKFMVTPATLLVLDEPTNHLDIQSKEMLEEAVKNFEGTVLAVSHDRYFLRQIATVRPLDPL